MSLHVIALSLHVIEIHVIFTLKTYEISFTLRVSTMKEYIRSLLTRWCDTLEADKPFVDAVRYVVESDAKHVRSVCVLSLLKGFNQQPNDTIERLILSIELVHASSLILDDLPCMDNASMRRGKITHHRVFGDAQTILVAFFLLNEAFRAVADDSFLATLLADIMGHKGLIMGQFLDLYGDKQTHDAITRIHSLKTSPLFTYALAGAAHCAGADDEFIASMRKAAYHIGIAFQLWDDYLDAYGTAEATGKDTGLDTQKYTHQHDKDSLLAAFENEYAAVIRYLNYPQCAALTEVFESLRRRVR